jgi:hypothetical protein
VWEIIFYSASPFRYDGLRFPDSIATICCGAFFTPKFIATKACSGA